MGKYRIAMNRAIAGAAMCAGIAAVSAADTAPAPAPDAAARRLVADRLLNDARSSARSSLPASLGARQAMLQLQSARDICPESLEILRALAEASRASGEREVLRDTLKRIIKLDPGDFVAQVGLITVMAESTQTIEEQARVYARTLESESLDPQVRSEIALKYARLLMQRGQDENARTVLDLAVKLNDVNAGAWREIIRLQSAGPVRVSDRMQAIVNCLMADPYSPQVWLAGGRALAATNQHDLAAAFLGTAFDSATRIGQSDGEMLLEWATELAIANDPRAEQVLTGISKLEDAPVAALITSLVYSGPSALVGPGVDARAERIRKHLTELVKAAPEEKSVLADAAWIEIFYMPEVNANATDYLDRLAKLAGEEDSAVKIRRGWLLLRQGNLDGASKILTPLAGKDPFAQLGIARIAAAQGDRKALEYNLQDLYNAHPTGLLALSVVTDARKAKYVLKDTPLGQATRKAATSLPTSVFTAQSSPRDLMLIMPQVAKRRYVFGEPIAVTLKVSNTTDRALSVGPDAAIKTSFGLAATMREPAAQTIGLYAMENTPRVYRLPARGSYTQTLRVDEDRIYEMFMTNAWKTYSLGIALITDPRMTGSGVIPGVGGQVIQAGEFTRESIALSKMEEAAKWADSLETLSPERQMTTGLVLVQLLPELTDAKIGKGAGSEAAIAARDKIVAALSKLLRGDSPVIKAWFLRVTPDGVPDQLQSALDAAARSPDAEARFAGLARKVSLANLSDAAARKALHDELAEYSRKQENALIKDFAATLAEIVMIPPAEVPATSTAPASAPASVPSTVPATAPASAPATAPESKPAATVPATERAPETMPGTAPK